jgi:hypothetical protein
MTNLFYDRRADRLSRAELEAIEVLKESGWTAIADVYLQDGKPELGDGSPTYRFEGRQPIAIFKDKDSFVNADTVEEVDEDAANPDQEVKRRGRPKKQ